MVRPDKDFLLKPSLFDRTDSCSSAEMRKLAVYPGDKVDRMASAIVKSCRDSLHVRFCSKVFVETIESIQDMTPEEIEAAWYSKQELKDMQNANDPTIDEITTGKYQGNDENNSARGLKSESELGLLHRRVSIFCGLTAVLDEQQRQQDEGIDETLALAFAYVYSNNNSQAKARLLGELDAKEAFEVHLETLHLTEG